jgi:hypothetical protein
VATAPHARKLPRFSSQLEANETQQELKEAQQAASEARQNADAFQQAAMTYQYGGHVGAPGAEPKHRAQPDAVAGSRELAAGMEQALKSGGQDTKLQRELQETQQRLRDVERDFNDVDDAYKKLHERFIRWRSDKGGAPRHCHRRESARSGAPTGRPASAQRSSRRTRPNCGRPSRS